MKLKHFILALVAMLSSFAFTANAQVAKVGEQPYGTIDEAIANWTNGTTLTLLADVTLSDVIKLNSDEYHILDLGTYTMTAAKYKDAIQYVVKGRSSAGYALDIKADANNPGGITASGKAIVTHTKPLMSAPDKDRPITRFYGGVFNATNIVKQGGSFGAGYTGSKAPYFYFYGGVFNGSISTNRSMVHFYGGVFNGNLYISVDSSSYGLVCGGSFKSLSNLQGSELNSDKFTIGSAKGVYDRSIYVDAEGYYVVTSEVITEVSAKYPASKKESYNSNNYFYYSAAATYGMFYEVASMAGTGSNVTIWVKPAVTIPENVTGDATVVEEIKNNTALKDYTPENLPKGAELEIELKSVGETFVYDVTPMANGTEVEPTEAIIFRLPVPASVTETYAKVYHEGDLMGIYAIQGDGNAKYVEISSADFSEFAVEPTTVAAKIGNNNYATFAEALAAAKAMTGDVTVEIYEKVTLDGPLTGSYSSIKFVGETESAEIYLDVQGYIEAAGKKVAFENLILSKSQGGFINNAGFMNVAFGVYNVAEVTYTNCTFANGAYASSGVVTFTGCTFMRSHDKYGLWAYGNVDVTVDGCTFADYRGIKMYAENGANAGVEKANLTVKNTDFSDVNNKPAIVLTYGESVTLENNTYSSKGVFELDLNGAPNGTPVTSDVLPTCVNDNGACGVLVDGKIYTTVAQAAEVATSGSTVTLLHNSTETVEFVQGVNLDKNGFAAAGVTVTQPVAKIGDTEYYTLSAAFAAVTDDNQTVVICKDVTENLTGAYLRGNITTENGAKVTITLTNSDWVYCPYTFVVGENVTLNVNYGLFYYAGGSVINGTVVTGAYYQRYGGTKLTINEPGSMTVTSETCILRLTDGDANAGIYINGDNDSSTVGLKLSVAYFYQGMINAKDANIVAGTYWQTQETDGQGSANLVLDNSTLKVTVNEHNAKATGNSTVTLTNGSKIIAAGGFKYGANTVLSVDATSSITDKNGDVKLPVAQIGTVKYATLQAAINAVKNGETITFLSDITENVTVTEKAGLYYTIDGDGKNMTGTITVSSLSDTEDNRRITIKNINFVDTVNGRDFITSTATNHYPRITVEGCSFTGTGKEAANSVAVRLKSSHSVVIKDCTGTGLHSFMQNTAGWDLTIENVKVTDSKSGLALGTVQGVTVKDCDITADGYGIRLDAGYNNNAVIESNKVESFIPVVVRKATVDSNITVQGTNTFTATNEDGLWMAIGTSEYEANGEMPAAATGKVRVTLNDANLSKDGVYGNYVPAAKIGEVEYATLAAAVADVQEGETITILAGTLSEGTIKLPATLKNVTIKGEEGAVLKDMTISAADGNSYNYVNLTFDGITFDNSRLLFTGWRNGEETIENLTITNCTFKDLDDTTNNAPVHINKDAAEAVNGFTFTNNVIDGATGGSKSGIYAQVTGNVVVENNVINNVSFRPYVIQVTTDDGIADNFTVTGNTFSGSAAGRAQGLGNNANGTDNVNLVVSNNIFKDITESQQICYWNFNAETTTADLSKNYYDIDIVANPSKIYFNSSAADNYALRDMNVFPIYTALNENGTINTESAFTPKFYIAKVGENSYETLAEALEAATEGATVTLLNNTTESIAAFDNVKLATAVAGGVTVKNTYSDWINMTNVAIGAGVTLDMKNVYYTNAGVNVIEGTLNATTLYNANNSKTTVQNGGKIATTGMIVNRYHTAADAGIYVYGDGDASTVEVKCDDTIGTYSGTFYAKDAVVNGNMLWIDYLKGSTQEADNYSQSKPVFENSTVNITKELRLYKDATLTLVNSDVTAGTVQIRENATPIVNVDANSTVKATSVQNLTGASMDAVLDENGFVSFNSIVAKIGGNKYYSLEAAFKAATSDCTIEILDNVTVDQAWDCRYTGSKFTVPVTINGNGKTIKFTASVNDNNYQAPFRFEADATVKNLTIDMSEVTDSRFRAISSKGNLTVDGCKFIGKDESLNCRAIIFGEGAGANVGNLAISITNSEFINWKRGITDNENGQDVKTATITGNTLENAAVYVSAYENVTFTGNTVEGAYVDIRSYTANSSLNVTATGNTLEENTDTAYNYIKATGNIDQEGFKVYAVAKIGDVEYTTIEKAYAALQEGDEIVILKKGSYALKVKNNVTITGAVDGVEFANIGAFGCGGANVTFNNVTFTYAANSTYNGLQHSGNLVYNNCIFNGQVFLYGQSETFNKCTFVNTGDNYNVWTYGAANVAFNECTFSCDGKSVLVYTEGANTYNNVSVTKCQFNAAQAVVGKAAIEMDSSLSAGINLTIDGETTATGFGNGNVSGNSLWNNKKGQETEANNDITVTVGDEVVLKPIVLSLAGEGTEANPYLINNVEELLWFQAKVDEQAADGSTQYAGKYIKLTADIDLAGINWNPIGSMTGDHGSFKGVFDGDNHTISNLKIEQDGNGLGLFAYTSGNAVIKNLKLNNVTVKSTNNSNYVGGVVGNAYASTKIENVHVTGDVLISGRGYIGGIAGHGYVVMDNVSVVANEGGLITSTFWCAGGVLGYAGEGTTNITNAHVEGLTVTSAAGGLGAIVGMAEDNNGTQPISGSNLSAKNVAIKTYVGDYGTSYADYALGYLYGGNETSKLTGDLVVENVTVETSSGVAPTIVDAVATVGDAVYFDFAAAMANANEGKTVKLFKDVVVAETFAPNGKTFTLDGNGKTISQAANCTNTYALFDITGGKVTIKNVTFDGVKGGAVVRTVGTEFAMDNVTAQNCEHTQQQGLFRLLGKNTITNSTFKNNNCSMVMTINYDGASDTPQVVDNCLFEGNIVNGTAALYYVKGAGFTLTNSEFVDNTVNCNNNGATIYLGFQENCTVTGNLFQDNVVADASSSTRVAGAIFFGYAANISGNAFVNNTASNADGSVLGQVCASTYYNCIIDLGKNYWGGEAPVYGTDYTVQHQTGQATFELNSYYTTCGTDEDGNVALSEEVTITNVAQVGKFGYTTLEAAIAAAKAGDVVTVFAGTYAMPSLKAGVTVEGAVNADGTPAVLLEGTLSGTLENLTMKNIHIKGGNAQRWAYAKGDLVFENVTFEATSVYALHFDGITEGTNLTYKNCTIIGWAAMGGSPASCVFEGCTIKGNGTYGLIRTYFATTIKDCTFDVANVNTTDNYQDGIHAVEGAIVTVDNCTNANGEMADIVNIHATSVVVLDGVEIKNVAKIGDTNYWTLQAAVDAATEGQTITVLTDIALAETVTVPADKTITLDLNGKTISQEKACTGNYNMILNKGNLTITDNTDEKSGKISFKDTGAGDPSYGWGSYTVRNEGTLVVENGTIEHLGEQAAHMYCAIFQYSGKSTINGGTISTPNYRSARLWKGDMTISGGTFDGQVWVQAADNSAKLTITGGTFEPNGQDASAVFVSNADKNVALAVTDGTFNGKIGCSDATKLAGAITGGKFNETAKNGTNAALLATGLAFGEADDNGYYAVEDDPATHYINNVEEFVAFRNAVNAGNDFAGVAVFLTADIDLAGIDWSVNIGDDCSATFDGTFDGLDHTIMNLTSTETAQKGDGYICTGLFGAIHGGAVLKNFTIENVNISTGDFTGNNVAAVVGFAYQATGSIENVEVTGNININAKNVTGVGAIIGYDYYSPALTVKDCSVIGNDGSAILGKSYVGGAVGYASSKIAINNNTVENVSVTATGSVGALAGIMLSGSSATDNTVKNVALTATGELWANSAAVVAGTITSGGVTVANTTVDNVTANDAAAALVGGQLVEKPTAPIAKVEAKIGDKYYTTLDAALATQGEATVELLAPVTVAAGETRVINLNGKTVVATDNATGSYAMITNKGDLTIEGEGAIKLEATINRGWNAYSSVISNTVGGKLTVNGGTIEHLGGTDMAYAIDNLTNGKGTYAETVINGGAIKSTYRAIRQFLNGVEAQNILIVNGGTIEGANKSIWMQDPSKNANTGTLTVAAGAKLTGDVYLFVTAGSTEWPVEVAIADAAFVTGTVVTGNVPAQYVVENVNGTWGVSDAVASVDGVGYTTLAEAVAEATDGATVTVLADITLNKTVTVAGKSITLDLNGKTVSGKCNASQSSLVCVENNADLTVKSSAGDGKLTFAQGSSNVGWTVDVKGEFTLESGTIELTGSWSIGYAVDVRPNSWGTEYTKPSVFTMNGGKIVSSDGAVRVASSSAAEHTGVSASFVMNDGFIDAAWDGVFVQQSDAIYDVLSFTMNGGTIESDLNPVRVYGPAATGYVNGQNCMSINFNGGTMTYTSTKAQDWAIDGILCVGGGSSLETVLASGNITASAAFAEKAITDGYMWVANSNGTYNVAKTVAKIDDVYYASLQAAIDAANEGDVVTLLADLTLTEGVTVAAGDEVTLDLNGKTITGTPAEAKAYAVITNKGTLTIKNGAVVCNHTLAGSTSYAVNTIVNSGELTVKNATIENKNAQGNQIGYAIDNNSTSYDATVVIGEGAVIKVSGSNYYDGIRQFANSTTKENNVIVRGGEVSSIWMQNPSDGATANTKDVKGSVTIEGGEVTALYLEPSANFEAAISSGYVGSVSYFQTADGRDLTQFITGGTFGMNVAEFVALGYECQDNNDGTYGIVESDYMVSYTIEDGKVTEFVNAHNITVGTLTYKRTIPSNALGNWQPLYVPFEIPVSMLIDAGYEVAFINDFRETINGDFEIVGDPVVEVIKITSGTLKANHPYVIKAKDTEALTLTLTLNNVVLHSTAAGAQHVVECSSATKTFEFFGNYVKSKKAELTGDDDCYVMSTSGALGTLSNTGSLGAFRIYMKITRKPGSPYYESTTTYNSIPIRLVGERNEDGTTIIYDVEMDAEQTVDYIYDLQGRRVLEPQKGNLYIINGKKVIF